jgi:hypothetical protein
MSRPSNTFAAIIRRILPPFSIFWGNQDDRFSQEQVHTARRCCVSGAERICKRAGYHQYDSAVGRNPVHPVLGVTNTATYGQTITATASQTRLSSFTFQLNQTSGTAPQYQAFVYQWDATNQRITGSALFASGVFTAPSGAAFSPVTINTGSVVLTPGQQYVLFLSTSNQQPQANGSYKYGSVANTAYAGGQFVFQNNGANFNQLSTTTWTTIAIDLAFQALISAGNTGENHAQAQSGAFQLATPIFRF